MSIKWVILGGLALVAGGAVIVKNLVEKDQSDKRVNEMVNNIDQAEDKEPKSEDEIEEIDETEVNQAIDEMDINVEADGTVLTDEKIDEIIKKGNELLKKMKELEEVAPPDISEDAIRAFMKAKELDAIYAASKSSDFRRMFELFDHRYNPYPVEISRASAFGQAKDEGLIDEKTFEAAKKYFGKLWDYVGD